ncbi:MAG: cytochrome b N-terminal domain-containing protein [Deltaproteobacteria bacterium]|nr:cytochrome b N-terminal domain-containing protein [Deltaproteobacteria bacterium]
MGWLVPGLHYHGGSAIVVIAGLHLVQTALAGAHRKPRELVWWTGVLLLVLVLAWAVTGLVLRWDQAGYWSNRVEIGIAAATPVVGDTIQKLALGGNDYGNLTLTRFYALHVIVLPAIVTLLVVGHIVLARRHGVTPMKTGAAAPRWPDQAIRDAIAMAIVFAVLLAYVVMQGGVSLEAPADPTRAYDARPLWYFRWLFELRELSGSAEQLVAMAVPAIAGGYLVAMPLFDKGGRKWLGGLAGLCALVVGLTVMSFARDAGDDELGKRLGEATERADRARTIAKTYGVPATGGHNIWSMAPMWKARTLYAQRCAGCHDANSKDRKGPIIGPGHGNRAWIAGFLQAPSSDAYWGKTKLSKTEAAMAPVDADPEKLEQFVEVIYAQSGALDVDAKKRDEGRKAFETMCTDCHSLTEGVSGSGPNLAGMGTRAHFWSFISNPKSGVHMGADASEMPRFDEELTIVERDQLAEYLVWLRTATEADLKALGPL